MRLKYQLQDYSVYVYVIEPHTHTKAHTTLTHIAQWLRRYLGGVELLEVLVEEGERGGEADGAVGGGAEVHLQQGEVHIA